MDSTVKHNSVLFANSQSVVRGTLRTALLAVLFSCAAAIGQDKSPAKEVSPNVMPVGDHLTLVQSDVIKKPTVGQTAEQVRALMGEPAGIDHLHNKKKGKFIWYYRPGSRDTLMLSFIDDRVRQVKTLNTEPDRRAPVDAPFGIPQVVDSRGSTSSYPWAFVVPDSLNSTSSPTSI